MAFSTYAELQASIADWLNRTDLTSQIKDFIAMVEVQANARLSVAEMEASTSLTLDANSEASLPADFLKPRQVTAASNPRRPLEAASMEFLDAKYGFRSAGVPKYYAIIGSNIRVLPKTTDTITLDYYQKIPALSDGNTSNWLLAKNPILYMYGAQMHASVFLKDAQGAQAFGSLYETEYLNLEKSDSKARSTNVRRRVLSPTP